VTFITPMDSDGEGDRLAVKDIIDVAGVPTTCGSRALAGRDGPADGDAVCLEGARRAGARIVGKTNLHELALGATGVNPWFGTPENPLDPSLVPGGSSSGSAVAVASGQADVAYGTDTGGSVRIPSACCGVAGLKTTHGRIPLDGVWPLALSLDTVGPLARDVSGLVRGMELLEPGFEVAPSTPTTVGRFRIDRIDPEVDAAVDRALALARFEVVDIDLPGWDGARSAGYLLLLAEAWENDGHLLERRDDIGPDVAVKIELGQNVGAEQVEEAGAAREDWRKEMASVFDRVDLIALPTMPTFPPSLDAVDEIALTHCVTAVNVAGLPALALPVPAGRLPASLQLLGPEGGEERLLAAGLVVEGTKP
jgi:amidase